MKLIIDIDKEEYEKVLKFPDCYAFGYAIVNSKPLQAELEEIKAEMEDKLEPFILGERNLKKGVLFA